MEPVFDGTSSNSSEEGMYEVCYQEDSVGRITITTGLEHKTYVYLEPKDEMTEEELEEAAEEGIEYISGEQLEVPDEHLERFAKFLIAAGNFLLERKKLKDSLAEKAKNV